MEGTPLAPYEKCLKQRASAEEGCPGIENLTVQVRRRREAWVEIEGCGCGGEAIPPPGIEMEAYYGTDEEGGSSLRGTGAGGAVPPPGIKIEAYGCSSCRCGAKERRYLLLRSKWRGTDEEGRWCQN